MNAFLALALLAAPPAAGDLVLTNARIYTVDAARSWASAVVIRDGRILYVGDEAGVARHATPGARRVDLGGRLVLPAFHDSHVHPVSAGVELGQCNLNGVKTAAEIESRVRAWMAAHPDAPWVVGGGWDLPLFPGANPRKEALDAIVRDRPAVLYAADGHSAWANSRALAAAGITRETPDPPRGRIERDPETGEPTGTLREAATHLVGSRAPELTAADRAAGLRRALQEMNRAGIVAFQEASAERDTLEAYLSAEREGWLTARARVSLHADPAAGVGQVGDLRRLREMGTRRVRPQAVKLFVDGVIEAHTAAVLAPYLAPAGGLGTPNFEPAALAGLVTALDREGFQVHMHAIGDAAIRMGLDAVEAAQKANGPRDARHNIAHIELFDPADLPRFRRLGVVANFQPLWAWADPYIVDLTQPVLGPARSRWLYPLRSMLDSGAVVAAGSDWSVSSVKPLDAIEVGVTRRSPSDGPGEAWIPEERATLAEMIAAYTVGGAYVAFEDRESGSLEPGKLADLVVLDRNLFDIPPHEINEAKVLWTLLEGATVWRDPALD
jgi:predicted amidohydrolase YtcJ